MKGKRFKKWMIGMAVSITFLVAGFFAFRQFIENEVNHLIGESLVKIIEAEYDDTYEINHDSVSINLFTSQIILSQITFKNKSFHQDSIFNKDRLLDASAEKIYLDVDRLWSIWLDNFLKIDKLTVFNPQLSIAKHQANKQHVSRQTGDFLKGIRKQLDLFQISLFEIQSAHLTFYEHKEDTIQEILVVPDMSMKIADFEWDTYEELGDIKSDDFSLSIKNQTIVLPKSEYKVGFDELSYSLKDNEIAFNGIDISTQAPKGSSRKNKDVVHLKIPRFSILGTDINEAYSNNSLQIDSILIAKPTIDWQRNSYLSKQARSRKKQEKVDNFIYAISSLFKEIQLQNLLLTEAKLEVEVVKTNEVKHYHSDKVSVAISDIRIDDLHKNSNSYNLSHNNLSLVSENVSSTLINGTHLINSRRMSYSSQDKILSLDSVIVAPQNKSENDSIVNIDLLLPKITLEDFDHKSLLQGIFNIDRLTVWEGNINLQSSNTKKKVSTPAIFQSFDLLFANNFKQSSVREFNLKNISINYQDRIGTSLTVKKADVTLTDIDLTNTKTSIQSTDNFFTNIDQIQLNLPREELHLESNDLHLDIKSGLLTAGYSDLSGPSMNLTFNEIELSSQDLSINGDSTLDYIDSLTLTDYTLTVNGSDSRDAQRSLKMFIRSSNLLNGDITVYGEDDEQLTLNADKISIGEIDINRDSISLASYNINLSNANYIEQSILYNADLINWNSDEHHLNIQNLTGGRLDSVYHRISIDSLQANEFNLNDLLSEGPIRINKLYLQTPKYSGNTPLENSSDDADSPPISSLIPPNFPTIWLDQIQVDKGRLASNSPEHNYLLTDVNLQINDINLSPNSANLNQPDYFLFSKSITGSIDTIATNDQNFTLNLQKLKILSGNAVKGENMKFLQYGIDTIKLDMESFEIAGIAFNRFFNDGNIEIDQLRLNKPSVQVAMPEQQSQNKNASITINNTRINDADITLITATGEQLNLSPVDITLKGFQYDSMVNMENTLIPAEYINLNSKSLEWTSRNSLDKIKIGGFSLNNHQEELIVENIRLTPLYERKEYMSKAGYETDWIQGEIKKVSITNMDFNRFIKERAIISEKIVVHEPHISVFRDKNMIDSLITSNKKLPAAMLRSLSTEVAIDSIKVVNGSITYREIAEKGSIPGVLTFDNFNVQVNNITNTPERIANNNVMRLNIQTDVMSEVAFDAGIRFYLDDPLDKFEFSGTVAPNDLIAFNRATEGIAFVHIRSGSSKKLKFAAVANNNIGYGTMYFQYNNLKIDVIDKETNEINKFQASIVSFLANTLFIKKRNLAVIKLRRGDIYFQRNRNKSIFNYLSKMFMSGVASSVGFKNYRKQIRQLRATNRQLNRKN